MVFVTQSIEKPQVITFEQFVQQKPDDSYYELHEGVIYPVPQPRGKHEEITGFVAGIITNEYLRLQLPYLIVKTALVKVSDKETAYSPDVLVLNRTNLINEPLWEQASTVQQADSIPLVVEVVSTNWRLDYLTKLKDYEEIGIKEYWIVDYLGLGAKRLIGNPKQPTVMVHSLVEGEYLVNLFRGNQRVVSPTFPELEVTANQIFQAN
jgi:Uma2 family endonuclease